MDVSFHLIRFVVSGWGLTRPAHWYYIRTRQRWSVPCHTQIGAAVSPSGVRLGAPLVAPYTTGTLDHACTVILLEPSGGANCRSVGRLGSFFSLEQNHNRFAMMMILCLIQSFSPPFFRPARKIWLLLLVVMVFSCCWFLRRRLTASKASSTTTTTLPPGT